MGCHVVLVDGEPVLPAREIPTLVTGAPALPDSLGTFLLRLFTGRMRTDEIEAEIAAQIAVLQCRGVRLTHMDTHKHTHMFSAVLRPVLRAARAAGIRAVRNPFEPEWAVRATARASWTRIARGALLALAGAGFAAILIEERGFVTTDGTIAMAGTGVLDTATVRSLLGATACRDVGAGDPSRL